MQCNTSCRQYEAWPYQPVQYPKTLTALLYRRRSPLAWGWQANHLLATLDDTTWTEQEYTYSQSFKLGLGDSTSAAAGGGAASAAPGSSADEPPPFELPQGLSVVQVRSC